MAFNQGCKGLVPGPQVSAEFAYYVLRHAEKELQANGLGTTFLELSRQQLRSVSIPFPPLPEQRAIASFLDERTARIDSLITKKRRLLELVAEKHQAVITRAVTQGIDPRARMKAADIPWFEEIPAHWTVKRLDHLNDPLRPIMYGIVLPGPDIPGGVLEWTP